MAGFAPEPCPTHTARKVLQSILSGAGVDTQTAERVTFPSLRLFMPNLAYTKGVPRHLRRYLGRWAKATTADIYTRDHRQIVQR
eukprot:2501036-Lingulodinium_polyedra.AAC.1